MLKLGKGTKNEKAGKAPDKENHGTCYPPCHEEVPGL